MLARRAPRSTSFWVVTKTFCFYAPLACGNCIKPTATGHGLRTLRSQLPATGWVTKWLWLWCQSQQKKIIPKTKNNNEATSRAGPAFNWNCPTHAMTISRCRISRQAQRQAAEEAGERLYNDNYKQFWLAWPFIKNKWSRSLPRQASQTKVGMGRDVVRAGVS